MFERWHDFYILVGSAAGALIGLLFIVVTLTSGMDRERALRGSSLYMAPAVVQFAAVLLISAVAAAPIGPVAARFLLLALGLATSIYATINVVRMFGAKDFQPTHWSDPIWYAIAPLVGYLALIAADVLAWTSPIHWPFAVGAMAVVFLLCGIRNAWDLVTWIAPGRPGEALPQTPTTPDATPPPE